MSAKRELVNKLTAAGYDVTPGFGPLVWVAGQLPIQIRYANKTERYGTNRVGYPNTKRWQFNLKNLLPESEAPLTALICGVGKHYKAFLIPTALLDNRKYFEISSPPDEYGGWAAHYLENYEIVATMLRLGDSVLRVPGWLSVKEGVV